jgi:hypothetical protein
VVSTYKYNGGGANQRGWWLGNPYGSSDVFYFRVFDEAGNNGSASLSGFFATYLDEWVHVAGVYKPGQSVALYVNGDKVDEDTMAVPSSIGLSGVFKIGARADSACQGLYATNADSCRKAGPRLIRSR